METDKGVLVTRAIRDITDATCSRRPGFGLPLLLNDLTTQSCGSIELFETVRVSKTGKRVDVSLTISPIKDSTGQ